MLYVVVFLGTLHCAVHHGTTVPLPNTIASRSTTHFAASVARCRLGGAESIILSAGGSESMMLSARAESIILSALLAEIIMLSA
jgi:hypothetical protein